METIIGVARWLAFYSVFYLIGCVALKVITLGRYPDLRKLRERPWRTLPDFDLVALLGLLLTVALAIIFGTRVG